MRASQSETKRTGEEPDWVSVSEPPPTAAERRKSLRARSINDVVWYGLTVALVLWIARGILGDPAYLAATLAMIAGFGGLFLWRNRSRVRDPWIGGFREDGRVGSTSESLVLEGWWGSLSIPWADLMPPVPVAIRGRIRFELRYQTNAKDRRTRVGPHWMKAILGLRFAPRWDLPLAFQSTLESELARSDRGTGSAPQSS
jgi:hypothetical protein